MGNERALEKSRRKICLYEKHTIYFLLHLVLVMVPESK